MDIITGKILKFTNCPDGQDHRKVYAAYCPYGAGGGGLLIQGPAKIPSFRNTFAFVEMEINVYT